MSHNAMESSTSSEERPANQEGPASEERPPPPDMSLAYRANTASGVLIGAREPVPHESFPSFPKSVKMEYSPQGDKLAIVTESDIHIIEAVSGEEICVIDHPKVLHIAFSPLGTYLVTWELPRNKGAQSSGDASSGPANNMFVWSASTGEEVHGFSQKQFSNWPSIRWSSDEVVSGRVVSNQVQFFSGVNFRTVTRVMKVPNVTQFSFSPGPEYNVCVFVPEKKGTAGSLRLYTYPNCASPLCSKSFFRAQSASMHWNPQGTAVLSVTHAELDVSGGSYYGETALFYLDASGDSERVALAVEGSVFDCAWRPDGKQFVVIYGSTPANITLFDKQRQPVVEFPPAHRNTAKWAPNNHILCIAGFGTFAGEVDFWDVKKNRKIGHMRAKDTITCAWSPDSKYFLTTTLFPRLRVDNGLKIYNYYGKLVYSQQFEELYQVCWRPMAANLFDPRPPPKVAAPEDLPPKEPAATTGGKYRHPRFSGSTSTSFAASQVKANAKPQKVKKAAPAGPAAQKVPVGFTPAGGAKKKKTKKKKAQQPEETGEKIANAFEMTVSAPNADENAKRVRTLTKKLRQIADLKEKQAAGLQLNAAQLTKLEGEAALQAELDQLQASS